MLLTSRQSDWVKGVGAVLLGLLSSVILVTGINDSPVAYIGDRIVDAINCGGKPHTDVHGIPYRGDPLAGKVGVASDFGSRLIIQRIHHADMVLLQTERYHTEDFSYEIRMTDREDGDYVLVLKFCEVYFHAPGQKVFSVMLNDEHRVVTDLDIFAQAGGQGIAHDEIIPFSISNGKLRVFDEVSDFNGRLRVTFLKGEHDNPKINALYVLKGTAEDVPELPQPMRHEEEEHDVDATEPAESDAEDEQSRKARLASGPKAPDPYASQDHSQMFLPILIALACFFPVLFCLCKL